jgi:hypothetical protein
MIWSFAMSKSDQQPEEEATEELLADMPLPSDAKTFFLGGIFVLSMLAAGYVASEIVLPLIFAVMLNLLMQPALRVLEGLRVPRTLTALLLILFVFATIVGLGAAVAGPAEAWMAKLPGFLRYRRLHRSTRREKRQSGQRRERLRPGSLHDAGAVVLHGALADAEIGRNVLAGLAGEHPFHHVALPRRQTREVTRCCRSPFHQLVGVMRQFESALDTCEEFLAADRLFDEIQRTRFHGFDSHRHIGVAGDHDCGQASTVNMKLLEQF